MLAASWNSLFNLITEWKDSIKQKKFINQVGVKYAVLVKSMISKKKMNYNSVLTKTPGIFEHVICSSQATITSYDVIQRNRVMLTI